jgi:lysophospholipase L1-like esterase
MTLRIVPLFAAGLLAALSAQAQLSDEFSAPRSNCCLVNSANSLANSARTLADQLQDWNQLGRYHAANEELKKQPADPKRVVFMGDSITDGWRLAEYFPGKPYVNRGISGQVTQQMLVRMYPDVINLKPGAMVVLAGTNDIARNNGPSTAAMIQDDIMAMTELAQAHGVKVVLCSVLPISDYPFLSSQQQQQQAAGGRGQQGPAGPGGPGGPGGRGMGRPRQTEGRPPSDILKINAWMKDYAAKVGAIYCDYFGATVDEKGWLKESISSDGLHPSADGYKIMTPLVEAALRKALP